MNIHFKNLYWVYLATLLSLPFGYFLRILYAKNLSLADYGLFYGLFSFFGLIVFLRNWGIGGATNFYSNKYLVKKEYNKVKTLFYFNQFVQLGLSILIGLILFLFNDWIFETFYSGEKNIETIFNIYILYWVTNTILATNVGFLGILENQKVASLLNLFNTILILTGSSIAFYFLDDFVVPSLMYFLVVLFLSIYSTIYLLIRYKKILFFPKCYYSKSFFKKVIQYSNRLAVAFLVNSVFVMTDTVVIQYFKGAEQVALYATAIATASLLTLFVFPALSVLSPLISKLWHQKEKQKIAEIIDTIINNYLVILLPFAIYFVLFANTFILTVFGEDYLGSVIILQIFVGAILLKNIIVLLGTVTASIGKPKESSKNTFISGMFNIIGNLLVINHFGILGIVYVTIFSYFLIIFLQTRLILTEIRLSFNLIHNIKIIFANVIFLFLVYSFKEFFYTEYISKGLVNLLLNGGLIFVLVGSVYVVLIFKLKIMTKEKINNLKKIIFPQTISN